MRWENKTSSEENEMNTTDKDRQEMRKILTQKSSEGLQKEQESIKNLVTKLLHYSKQDREFRKTILEMLQELEQKESVIDSEEDREKVIAETTERRKELEQEEKTRRMIVDEIKKDFWKGRGRGIVREADRQGSSQHFPQ